jgi:hypothetical protein
MAAAQAITMVAGNKAKTGKKATATSASASTASAKPQPSGNKTGKGNSKKLTGFTLFMKETRVRSAY